MPNARMSAIGLVVVWTAGLTSAGPVTAEIALDGSTGSAGALTGPDFQIPAALGRREGGNLFHSFATFSIRRGESATFSGPGGIDNVISRVTGGEASTIDGALTSTIPGADFFFLNPAGVIFGPNALLDIQGSFHVSTAEELRFTDGEVFSATDPAAGSFTMAAPEAFGFLGSQAGSITLSTVALALDTPDVAPFDTTISLVGGDITLDSSAIVFAVPTVVSVEDFERGNVNLVAMSTPGQVSLDGRPSVAAQGTINILGGGFINVSSNNGGGTVRIHAGDLILDGGASIASDNGFLDGTRPENGDGPQSGGVEITAGHLRVLNGGFIQSNTFGDGDAGNIVLSVGELDVITEVGTRDTETRISSDTQGGGRAGDISILNAQSVTVIGDERFRGRTEISSEVAGDPAATGRAGDIRIESDQVIVRNDGFITSSSRGPGDAGSVTVEAGSVSLEGGGQIGSSTIGLEFSTGRGGSVTVNAREEILITGDGPFSPVTMVPEPSGIFASSESEIGGPAGDVRVMAPVIRLADRGEISSESFNENPGGQVTVSFDRLEVDDAEITTQARFGDAGDIEVAGSGLINLKNGGEISTTVFRPGSAGNAGDIGVSAGSIVLNAGIIQANGVEGQGGNISVTARDTLIRTDDSVIEALSQLGIDGTVSIDAPAEDVLQSLDVLPTEFLDASSLLTEDCAARAARGGDPGGSLVGEGQGGVPPSPDATLPGYYSDMTARESSSAVQEARLNSLLTCEVKR